MGNGGTFRESSSITMYFGNHKETGVKYVSANTVYGTNTDLSFIEKFIEPAKIYNPEESNSSPTTHDSVL